MKGKETENGKPLYLTQRDIREVQLAKAAIFAGIKILLKEVNIPLEDIQEILLAGAFGNFIDKKSAVRIGLLPNLPLKKIESVGNAAGRGAERVDLRQYVKVKDTDEYIPTHKGINFSAEWIDDFVKMVEKLKAPVQ